MKKILYSKLTGNKLQGEFRTFDVDNLANIITTNEIINVSKYRGKYDIYEKNELQSKYVTSEEVKNAPRLILVKKGERS